MSSESMRRCSYYPNCAIHTGERPQRQGVAWLTPQNRRDIVEDRRDGLELHVIARLFGVSQSTVSRVLHSYRLRKGIVDGRSDRVPARTGRLFGSFDPPAGA